MIVSETNKLSRKGMKELRGYKMRASGNVIASVSARILAHVDFIELRLATSRYFFLEPSLSCGSSDHPLLAPACGHKHANKL